MLRPFWRQASVGRAAAVCHFGALVLDFWRVFTLCNKASNDYDMVTRTYLAHDSQRWRFKPVGYVCTVQQNVNSRYLDAFTSGSYSAVNRPRQADATTQQWVFYEENEGIQPYYRIQQLATRRFLDAYESSSSDLSVVTRTLQNNDSQKWKLVPKSLNLYTIQQKVNERYMDAYETSKEDYDVVTGTKKFVATMAPHPCGCGVRNPTIRELPLPGCLPVFAKRCCGGGPRASKQ